MILFHLQPYVTAIISLLDLSHADRLGIMYDWFSEIISKIFRLSSNLVRL